MPSASEEEKDGDKMMLLKCKAFQEKAAHR